jgi:hypothetical protein
MWTKARTSGPCLSRLHQIQKNPINLPVLVAHQAYVNGLNPAMPHYASYTGCTGATS